MVTASPVSVLDLLSTTDNNGVTTYFLQDGLGSTTGLTDDDGVVTDTYTYDVFGALKTHGGTPGTSANAWKFTGELNDSTVGRSPYYLRARYYDPALGRFLSRDPFAGHLTSPQTQNRYAYVSNSCPNRTDPWGLDPIPQIPDATMECVSQVEVWDLFGRVSVPLPFGKRIETPAWKLFRFELHSTYYQHEGDIYTHDIWADEVYLSTGWHIDRSSLEYGWKEGGGAMATARFGAGGANPWGLWPAGFNTDVELRQRISAGGVVGSESTQQNPFRFPGITTKSGTTCGGWQ